jgi:hypothetical protein
MDYAYELQDEAFFLGPYAPLKIKHKPSHYMKKLHMDTVTYNAPALKMVIEWMGADHVLYGSDAPPLTSLKPRDQARCRARYSEQRKGEDTLDQCAALAQDELSSLRPSRST